MRFHDRTHAGQLLGSMLAPYRDATNAVVIALPRGGVPVGAEVARALHLPLHILVVRKIGHPWNPEVAVGAVSEFGIVIGDNTQTKTISEEYHETHRRRELYEPTGLPSLQDNTVILVDDGIATGFTMQLAVEEVRRLGAQRVVVAVPVSSQEAATTLRSLADEFVTLNIPEFFSGVGAHYDTFPQTSDKEVVALLNAHSPRRLSHQSS